MTPEELAALSDGDLSAMTSLVSAEMERRRTLASIPAKVEALNRSYLDAERTATGDEWRQPVAAFDAYPQGWVVQHQGKTWESLTPSNVWEPGVSGWREVEAEDSPPPAWIAPTGSHDAYPKGATVTFGDYIYQSLIDTNVWSPSDYPAGWQKL